MNIRILAVASAASFLLAGAALAADQPGHQSPAPGTSHESMSAVKDATAGVVGKMDAAMTRTAKGFVEAAAISDMYEVEAGKLASERGKSQAVRQFGEQMVAAHTDSTNKLKSILASNKLAITPPSSLDSRRQGMIDDLKGAKEADFDHRYAVQQVAAHKEADTLMSGYAKHGDNDAIKSFAREIDPVVKQHLAMAQKLEKGPGMAKK